MYCSCLLHIEVMKSIRVFGKLFEIPFASAPFPPHVIRYCSAQGVVLQLNRFLSDFEIHNYKSNVIYSIC